MHCCVCESPCSHTPTPSYCARHGIHPMPCPRCGYCPTCGRGFFRPVVDPGFYLPWTVWPSTTTTDTYDTGFHVWSF